MSQTKTRSNPLQSILEVLDADKPKGEPTLADIINDMFRHPERYMKKQEVKETDHERISSLPTVVSGNRQGR